MNAITKTAIELAYDTNNLVLCDLGLGPAELGLSIKNVSRGSAFRTISVSLAVCGASGPVTIYHLLLPPGHTPPTAQQILNYQDEESLITGAAVRGQYLARGDMKNICYLISRNLSPSPYDGEAGPVDGYRYDCYFLAVDCTGKSSYVVKYRAPAMAMPFAAGKGTEGAPFELRELTAEELLNYPDLLARHPANLTGVHESARMLSNIERLQTLYDETDGIYGMPDSLSRCYRLATPMDLINYREAYSGLGWQPIGNADASTPGRSGRHVFCGRFIAQGDKTVISNLWIAATTPDGSLYHNAGLFGVMENATVAHVSIEGAALFALAVPEDGNDALNTGTLAGSMKNCALKDIHINGAVMLAASLPGFSAAIRIGGITGYATNNTALSQCSVSDTLLVNPNEGYGMIGGLIGEIRSLPNHHATTLYRISVQSNTLLGWTAIGGIIGYANGGLTKVQHLRIDDVFLSFAAYGAGGFAGVWESAGSIKEQCAEDIEAVSLNLSSFGDNATSAGGLIGELYANVPTCMKNLRVRDSSIACYRNCGGMLGWAGSDYGELLHIEDCAVDAEVTGGISTGGFAGQTYSVGSFERCRASGGGLAGALITGGFAGYARYSRFMCCEAGSPIQPIGTVGTLTGGFVGLSEMSAYEDCHAQGDVAAIQGVCGGFAGLQLGETDELLPALMEQYVRCSATGNVRAALADNTPFFLGGFMGIGTLFLMRECFATGAVASLGIGLGGLIAGIFIPGSGTGLVKPIVEDCYSTSNLTGRGPDDAASLAGGIIGFAAQGLIRRCYYTGSIRADYPLGGIIAQGASAPGAVEIYNCLLLTGNIYGNSGEAYRIISGNGALARLNSNYAVDAFHLYDNGTLVDVIDDPDGQDGQTIGLGEVPWFLKNVLQWDTGCIWSLRPWQALSRPLLMRNMEAICL